MSDKRELELLEKVVEFFKDIRKEYSNITDDMLDNNGAIYYMNGNDGTHFDWNCNDRLCEFVVFYKSEYGFIKVILDKDDVLTGYVYKDRGYEPVGRYERQLEDGVAWSLKNLLLREADNEGLFDFDINEIIK